ncbi:bifunctional diguanylate cyclase/phosphodiesterase [Tsukamurella sp. 8J]|nr:bifunctional diguanylate cyclase/phosphodiesterase [Tsukamurella sp. 8J]MDF0529179.1 bifunctional diguanylate cyclase/phosphodiesterase [Tsukamurella sp. 8J]
MRNQGWFSAFALLVLVPLVGIAVFAQVMDNDPLAEALAVITSAVAGSAVLIAGIRLGESAVVTPLAVGLLSTAVIQTIDHYSPHDSVTTPALEVAVLCAHSIVAFGVMRWLRAHGLSDQRSWPLLLLPVVFVPLVWGGSMLWLGAGVAHLHDPRVAAVLCVSVDAAILVTVMQVSLVTARHNRAFNFMCYGFAVNVAAGVALVMGAWGGHPMPTLYRSLVVIALALFAAAAVHPDFARHAPPDAMQVRRGAYQVVEIATVGVAVAIAPGFGGARGELGATLRMLVVAGLVALILTRTDRALRDLEREAAAARYDGTHDALTGLPNRTRLAEVMAAEKNSRSVLYLGVDGLRTVADSFGRGVGDRALVEVARRVQQVVGSQGSTYRVGGEDFVIVTDMRAAVAAALGEHLVTSVSEPFRIGDARIALTAHVGVGQASDGTVPVDVVREADAAMQSARADGAQPVVVFDERLRAEALDRLELTAGLREAVANGSFELNYQPIVSNTTGRVVAYEALLRWHREGDVVNPEEFMEVAESSGLIVEIGDWVLDAALSEIGRHRRSGGRSAVSVNLSARQLQDPGLAERVDRALARHGVPPSALWIELTETALIADTDNAARVLSDLADLGVRVSLDDFGVGYSALNHLSQFPISVVKIDKSFVRALGDDDGYKRQVVVSAIVAMCRSLGIETVAEGIEDASLATRVRDLGCTYSQGWFHGRPEPFTAAFAG